MLDFEAVHDVVSQHLNTWIHNTNQSPINKNADEFLKSALPSLNALSESRIAAFIYN